MGGIGNGGNLGTATATVGDVDCDGVVDIAVGLQSDDDGGSGRGAVWVLFLNTAGTVKGSQKISNTQGGFTGGLDNSDAFGSSVAVLGDLNGDGAVEVAVGTPEDDDGGNNRGAVWTLFLGCACFISMSDLYTQVSILGTQTHHVELKSAFCKAMSV